MKKTKKINLILLAVILLAVSTIVVVFVGYRRISTAPEILLSSIKEGANLSIGKIRQTATRDGRKEWSLEANSAHYIETEKKAVLKDLTVTFFLENQGEVYLNAEQGILKTNTNDIEFSGNVVIKNADYKMTTDRLNYRHSQRLIFSNDPVHVSGKSADLQAESISYDLNSNKIELTGKVDATISEEFAL
ncbi:MAG: LPS export ABC transporter periplasmic protein LptC [Desulfobacterales bacterium]